MPTSDQSGFDRAPPDFTKQADFDAASMQLLQRIVDLVGDSMVSLTEKTSKVSAALQIMEQMGQSVADNGLDLVKVLDRQRALVLGVADAVSKSNLSYDQQSKIEAQLTGVVKAYAAQMDRIIKQEKIKLRELREGTTEYNKQKAAIDKATKAAEAQNKALMEAVKIRQRAAQRGGASKRIGSFSSNLGNLTDAAASDTSGLSGWFNSKKETSKKDVLHHSGAWKGSGWGTLDTGKLESNWKSLGVTIGVATVAAGKALGDLAKKFESAAVGLAQYKNNVEQAARAMGMMDAKPLEALRSSLDMTRNQAAQLFSVMDQGMSATGKTAAELSNIAQTLKDTFGGDITEQLKTYIDLMKEIPTLQEDLTNGSSEDQTAALYGLASKGKAGELNALMPSGLFGGEQQRQPGADKLDVAQSASSKTEQLGDFLMGLMPNWTSYFAEIPNLVSTFGDVAQVIPTVAGAIEATVLLNNSRRMAQSATESAETQAKIDKVDESLKQLSEVSNSDLKELQNQNAQSQSSIESAIINSSGGRQIEAQVRKAIPQGAPKIPRLKNPLSSRQRIDLSALGNVKSASGASGMFGKLGGLMGKSGLARMGMMAAGVMAWQLSQKGAGIAHDRAKRDLARGDLRNAKNNVYASRAISILGGAAAGAAIGKQFGPWGVAIGAAVGVLGGFIKSVVDTQDTLNKIRAEEQKNIKEFGTAIIPLTQGKADFDKAMKFSGGLVRASAEKQAQAARALQNALGELSAGVNNAKIQFYALQKELSNLRITRFKRYGAPDAQSAMNAMRMSMTAARNTYDTKMGAVNRARDRAKNDKGMTTEARQALLTQAAKEEEVALNELLEATLNASEALSAMPEYIAAGISSDAITDVLTKGLVDTGDIGTVLQNGMDAWASSLDEINKVAASKTEGLQKAQELANKNGVANVQAFLKKMGGTSRQHVLTDKEREDLEERRANLVSANARIKKYGGYKDLTQEEQMAWDKLRSQDKVSSFWAGVQRNTLGWADSRDTASGELGQNQAAIEAIDEALKGVDNAIASNAMVQLNQRYGSEMKGVVGQNGEIDKVKAASLVAKMQTEAAEKRNAMEKEFGVAKTQDIINLRSLEQHKTKRDALEAQRKELTLGGKTDEATKVQEQIENMNATFASTLQPTLDRLFASTGMTDEQKKSASEYIQENGFDRFMSSLNAGKDAEKMFGGQGTSKEIVEAIKKQANAFAEANKMATELGVLDDAINNFSSLTVDNFAEILKVEQQRSTAVAEKNEQMVNWLKAISQGVDKNTAELRTAAKLANAKASLAGVGGTGTKEAGEALAAQIKAYGASTAAAAEALEKMPLVIANLENQVQEAESRKEAAQTLVDNLEKQYNAQFGGKSEKDLTEAEKTAAKDMKDQIDKAKATLNVQISDVAKLNKNIESAKTTQAESHETLATNARANINFMQTVADQIQKGMESTKGLMAKALSEAATTGFEAARFADNVAEGAAAARDIAIDSANRQAEIEIQAADEAFKNLPEMAKQAGEAAAAAIRSGAYNEAFSKALGEGKTEEEAKKLAEAAKEAANSAAEAARSAAEADVTDQGRVKYAQTIAQLELTRKKNHLESIKQEADLRRKTVELQQQAVDEMRDFAENYGGSFAEVLQLQNMSVQLERQKLDIAKDELANAEAAGASGQQLMEAQQKVLMQEIAVRKKEIGVAKSMMDRMLGAAFGQIRQSFGARVQMGTAQHLMGTENTRIKRADGTYMAGDSRTIESRQFERQVNGAFGANPDVLSGVGKGESPDKTSTEMAAKVMHDSADKQMDAANVQYNAAKLFNDVISGNKSLGQYTLGASRNPETYLWNSATGTGARTMGNGNPPTIKNQIVSQSIPTTMVNGNSSSIIDTTTMSKSQLEEYNARQEAINVAMLRDERGGVTNSGKTASSSSGSKGSGRTSAISSIRGSGGMGATRQTLGGEVQNGFVGYNGDIRHFTGYNTPIDQFAGAKGMSASALVRGADGKLYNKDGSRADARSMFVGGREGKKLTTFGSREREDRDDRESHTKNLIASQAKKDKTWAGMKAMEGHTMHYQGIKNAESMREGMDKSQKAHKNEFTGLTSGKSNAPGVAAQGAGGGGSGGGLSGKVSGSVELNINPEVFKQTVAPIVMDVVLENAGKISNILMG